MPMRIVSFLMFLVLLAGQTAAQKRVIGTHTIALPDSLRTGSREISGLAVHGERLYFLAENRDDHLKVPSSGIYSVPLDEIQKAVADPTYQVGGSVHHAVKGIDRMMQKLEGYQGLEAIAFHGDRFFLSVETELFADNCYILTGELSAGGLFELDTARVAHLPKPLLDSGDKVFNGGFETLTFHRGVLYAFFEYNGFASNKVFKISPETLEADTMPFDNGIPFRLTDAISWNKRTLLALNFFFPLEAEKIYQVGLTPEQTDLITGQGGKMRPFARLVTLKIRRRRVVPGRFISLPETWWGSNWEGIVQFEKGVLIVNDKFAGEGKQETQLIYLHLKKK